MSGYKPERTGLIMAVHEVKLKIQEESDLFSPLDPEPPKQAAGYHQARFTKPHTERNLSGYLWCRRSCCLAVSVGQNRKRKCGDPLDHRLGCSLGSDKHRNHGTPAASSVKKRV